MSDYEKEIIKAYVKGIKHLEQAIIKLREQSEMVDTWSHMDDILSDIDKEYNEFSDFFGR